MRWLRRSSKRRRVAVRGVKEFTRVAYDMPLAGAVDYARNLHSLINTAGEMRRKNH